MSLTLELGKVVEPVETTGAEHRRLERYQPQDEMIFRFLLRPEFQSYQAMVRDISLTGIGFIFDRPLDSGTIMALQLASASDGASQVRTAEVVHVRPYSMEEHESWRTPPFMKWLRGVLGLKSAKKRPEREYWLIGCHFRPSLTEEELQGILGK